MRGLEVRGRMKCLHAGAIDLDGLDNHGAVVLVGGADNERLEGIAGVEPICSRWARRFGANMQTSPHTTREGKLTTHICAEWDYYGIAVEAYAFVPAEAATT